MDGFCDPRFAPVEVATFRQVLHLSPEYLAQIARSHSFVALHDDSRTIAVSDDNGSNILKIEVEAGTVTIKASTKVVVDAPAIELVANASHPAVFGDKLTTYLNQLVQSLNLHMHPGQQAGPFPVTPAPPTAPATPPTPEILSTTVKLG